MGSRKPVAIVATIGFAVMCVFQVLLAAGVSLGDAAWGGTSTTLTPPLRIASAVSALLFVAAGWAVLAAAGVLRSSAFARAAARSTLWGFAGLFAASGVLNVFSSSPWERFLMAPLALLLTACCVWIGLERQPPLA